MSNPLLSAAPYRGWVLAFVLVLVLAEMIWSWRRHRHVYHTRETFTNLGILLGFQLSKALLAGYALTILGAFAALRPWALPERAPVFLLTFLAVDFTYYWGHRLSHQVRFLWAFHEVHHSSPWLNLTTAYRLNWLTGLVSPFFNAPLVLLGLPLDYIIISYALNLGYQFLCHTEAVGRLGPLEYVFDTPSNHRVHHGSNPEYIDRNFGGVLMIWDHLFGTYQAEHARPRYGLPEGFVSHNPFVLIFHGFRGLWRRPPGKQPE